jgi:hypothetical protein
MKATVVIDGREAVPVRAIPFVTGWRLSPDMIAKDLAKEGHRRRFKETLQAFQYDPENRHPLTLPDEWDQILVRLNALNVMLDRSNGGERDEITYARWRDESPGCLPRGCFVWRDEFETTYRKGHTSAARHDIDEESLPLNFFPLVPTELEAVVMEGFQFHVRASTRTKIAATKWPWGDHDTKNLRALAEAAGKFWALYDPTDTSTAPKNEEVVAWLESRGVTNNIAKAIATILRADDLPTGPRK